MAVVKSCHAATVCNSNLESSEMDYYKVLMATIWSNLSIAYKKK